MSEGILEGIRILDMSSGIPGPVAAMLLAEAGADVVKIEPPEGDPMRAATPGFVTWNRSKRGITLDLADSGDRTTLDELLAGADVLLHGLRPSVARRHGLDDDTLLARFPALVTCAVLGYPVGHRDADRPGYEGLVCARMGLMDEQKGHRDGPVFFRLPIASWGAVYLAAIGILARLHIRERTGRGGPAHTSLYQGALAPMTQYWARAEHPTERFTRSVPKNMASGIYECGDGRHLHSVGRVTPEAVPLVAETMARLTDEEIEDGRRRMEGWMSFNAQGNAELVATFLKRPVDDWLDALREADVAVMDSARPGDVFRDAQARENGFVIEVEHPTLGRLWQAGTPFRTEPPSRIRGPAPEPGQHDGEVRAEVRPPIADVAGDSPPRWPLEGIKVLDLGNFLAGPFGPMLMADLGADVIKLEATTGDMMRVAAERSVAGCQRGKRGIALDLKQPASRPVFEALVRWADVVHHNLRYPAARRLAIDYDSVRAIDDTVIYCHTSSYGPVGARKDWPGYDQMFQAISGWEVAGGGRGMPPIWHRVGMMDHQNAMGSVVAVLLALRERARTGRGQFVTNALLGGCALTASELYLRADDTLPPFPELDAEQMGIGPGYRMFEVADGYVAVAALSTAQQEALAGVAGVARIEDAAAPLAGREQGELLAALDAAGVPSEPVRLDQLDAFFDDEHHRRLQLAVRYPHKIMGEMEQIGALWHFGDVGLRFDYAPPDIGEHSQEILLECGFSPAEIDALVEQRVVAVDGSLAPA